MTETRLKILFTIVCGLVLWFVFSTAGDNHLSNKEDMTQHDKRVLEFFSPRTVYFDVFYGETYYFLFESGLLPYEAGIRHVDIKKSRGRWVEISPRMEKLYEEAAKIRRAEWEIERKKRKIIQDSISEVHQQYIDSAYNDALNKSYYDEETFDDFKEK
jgi:hypothetical protein